ncbi:MAG: hypothetical protein C5B54_01455, partial [Acidobacteria bacterium]
MSTGTEWLHNTTRYHLPNKLTLLTHHLPNSEAAGLHFNVQAGYFCETDAEVGLAHLLEHMYFKGSKSFPDPGTLGVRMKSLGGMINATTSYDQTTYFCEVPAENLVPALEIMGDAFVAPLFPDDELRKECEVVIEEFNRKIDSPAAYSQELLIQLAYKKHRMKRWRIGTPEQLRSYKSEHLFDYFHRYYQPQNMIVTITGKFDEDQIHEQVQRLFSLMKNQELRKDFGPSEPGQAELRYEFKKATAMQSYLHMAFHVPGVTDPEGPALDFLNALLTQGRSARLHRYLVEQRRSASAASSSYAAYEDVGLLLFTAVTESNSIRTAARDIWSVLQDLIHNGIPEAELQKVKYKLRLHQLMQTEDVLNLAQMLSYYEAYGGYERLEEYLQKMHDLSEDEILNVARKHLTLKNLSLLEFVNEDIPALTAAEYANNLDGSVPAPEITLPAPMLIHEENRVGNPVTAINPIIQQDGTTFILHPDQQFPYIAAGISF